MRIGLREAALAFLIGCATCNGQVVEIPDPVLEGLVRSKLEIPLGDLQAADMQRLTELEYHVSVWRSIVPDDEPIRDLTGLEYASNLETLKLTASNAFRESYLGPGIDIQYGNAVVVEDFQALSGLEHLNRIEITGNPELTRVVIPEKINNLRVLILSYNNIKELGLPPSMESLDTLDVSRNQLETITLDGTPAIKSLKVADNHPIMEH